MKNRKISLNSLFFNDKFLALFSLLAAFVFWLFVVASLSPVTTRELKNVPVKFELSSAAEDAGFKCFSDDMDVDFSITGERYLISSGKVAPEDFSAVAEVYQTTPGKYSLALNLQCSSLDISEYEVTYQSLLSIDVFVDKESTREITELSLADSEINSRFIDDSKHVLGETDFGVGSIKVNGPATQVDKIERILFVPDTEDMPKVISETDTYNATIYSLSSSGEVLNYISYGNNSFGVTVPVYEVADYNCAVTLENSPGEKVEKDLTFKYSPETYTFIAAEHNGDSAIIGSVDFAQIRPGVNQFKFNMNGIDNAKHIDGSMLIKGADKTFALNVTVPSTYIERPIKISTSLIKQHDGSPAAISGDTVDLIVCGKLEDIEALDIENASVIANKTDFGNSIVIDGAENVWVYGYYS